MLVSGSGSNLQALIDNQGDYRICLVVSDQPQARALQRAEEAAITTEVCEWSGDRGAFTSSICDAVAASGAQLMVLAGFMRILGPEAITRFPDRIINIHPSLLPAFPGAHAVDNALDYGVKVTGVTVHFVDEEVDHGPIIAQVPVQVRPDDDRERLHARLQVEEHRLYPEVVAGLAQGEITVEDRRVEWRNR